MKKRIDFVTNSSSSSFLICKKHLDEEQVEAIRNHSELGKRLGLSWANEAWEIEENDNFIMGYTVIDNFYIADLFNIIGISPNIITWDEWRQDLPDEAKSAPAEKEEWRILLSDIKEGKPFDYKPTEEELKFLNLFTGGINHEN